MGKIFLFDVDGTLTPSKSKIDEFFSGQFRTWMSGREVYIVSGGSFVRLVNQLGISIISMTQGVFACMGNAFYQPREQINYSGMNEWDLIYENKFVAPKNLYRSLNSYVAKSNYHTKTGNHYEEREGMLNFCVPGRNAGTAARKEYAAYDAIHGERERIAKKLRKKYPDMDFAIGGAVSIDIFNKGNDKSQIIPRYFKETIEHNQIHFVGDRIRFPGNDHSLAQILDAHPNGSAHEVESWQDTAELLKTKPFA